MPICADKFCGSRSSALLDSARALSLLDALAEIAE
jgi:hypothetical protein